MPVQLRPLFGLTCTGEAMPPGSDAEMAAALREAGPLLSAIERPPAPAIGQDRGPEQRPPAPEPDFAPGPSFSPRR